MDPDEYDKLKWLLNYQDFIRDLSILNKTINQIEKVLKYKSPMCQDSCRMKKSRSDNYEVQSSSKKNNFEACLSSPK